MKISKRKVIYWGEARGASASARKDTTYLFGTTLIYHAPDFISFENPLMASGQILHEWSSSCQYQEERLTPTLPLLKKGKQYRIIRKMESFPEFSVFFKISFLNRYGEEIGNKVEREDILTFTYPLEAYSYKIQLLSAGLRSFDFHYLELQAINEEVDDKK